MKNDQSPALESVALPAARLRTIAEELGLSVATVSRALGRVAGINPKTRVRVLQSAAKWGYQPAAFYRPRVFSEKTLHQIGVFIEMAGSGTPPDGYLIGMSEAALSLDASLVIHYVKPEDRERLLKPKFQPRAMASGLLSGLILVFRWPTEIVQALSRRMPTVSITHRYPDVDTDLVGIENVGGIEDLVRYLHGLGHRRIGFLGRCGELHWSAMRFGGYVAALTTLGLPYDPEWVIDVDLARLINDRENAGWEAYGERVKGLIQVEGVSAWVCASEPAGWQLVAFLETNGIRVPQQVSVTGFHAPDRPEAGKPVMTSVTASYEAMGAAALKRALNRIQNPAQPTRTVLFRGTLQVGDTTGAPPPPP